MINAVMGAHVMLRVVWLTLLRLYQALIMILHCHALLKLPPAKSTSTLILSHLPFLAWRTCRAVMMSRRLALGGEGRVAGLGALPLLAAILLLADRGRWRSAPVV